MDTTIPKSTKIKTPDGARYATMIDGAHVIGDVVPTEEGIEAIRDLIAVARKRIETDDLMKLQSESQGSD